MRLPCRPMIIDYILYIPQETVNSSGWEGKIGLVARRTITLKGLIITPFTTYHAEDYRPVAESRFTNGRSRGERRVSWCPFRRHRTGTSYLSVAISLGPTTVVAVAISTKIGSFVPGGTSSTGTRRAGGERVWTNDSQQISIIT